MNKIVFFVFTFFCFSIANIYAQTEVAYADSGFMKYVKEDYIGAIKEYTEAISLNPKKESYYIFRGFSNMKIKNYKEAIADFSIAIELKPGYYSYYLNRATVMQLIGDKDGACSDFKKYIEISGLRLNDEIKKYCDGL